MAVPVTDVPVPAAPAEPPVARRPGRSRFWVAAVLGLVGLGAYVVWSWATFVAVAGHFEAFPNGPVPGVVTTELHPGTYHVYAQAGGAVAVRVTGPGNVEVPLTAVKPGPFDYAYEPSGGASWPEVARFDVAPGRMGEYSIAATSPGTAAGTLPESSSFAVGEFDVSGFMLPQRIAKLVMLLVGVLAAVAVAAGRIAWLPASPRQRRSRNA